MNLYRNGFHGMRPWPALIWATPYKEAAGDRVVLFLSNSNYMPQRGFSSLAKIRFQSRDTVSGVPQKIGHPGRAISCGWKVALSMKYSRALFGNFFSSTMSCTG